MSARHRSVVATFAVAAALLFLGVPARAAAATLTWSQATNVAIGSATYAISAGSAATSLTVGVTSITVVVPSGSTFTLVSANRHTLANDQNIPEECTETSNTLVISGSTTVVITPNTTACVVPRRVTDSAPPANPTALTATPSASQIALTWVDPSDADLSLLRIIRAVGDSPATTLIGTVWKGVQRYTDTDVTIGVSYTYSVEAVDRVGNRSSGPLMVATVSSVAPTSPPPSSAAPCVLTTVERMALEDAFLQTQGRAPTSARDAAFLCALRSDPAQSVDPTQAFPEYRNTAAEARAVENFTSFFKRAPGSDAQGRAVSAEARDRDWWAVRYMAYHLRLASTIRDAAAERTCLRMFLDRDVELAKDGARVRKPKGAPPRERWDYDFIRACTYSGITSVR